ncbi:peptidoglycan bridge formation glycyltransferase FemA/FemB family protein [Candidatus Gottesmanbacteria bacterium]|nr:peptidoglycan bridge formation glycyltransferase FemA/FemB family protein [Candidatus Gottesmanbacteria bacterium]
MDIRQSSQYSKYLRQIGWQIEKIDNWNVFIRDIPLYGKFAKLQKITPLIPFDKIKKFKKEKNIRRLIIEPDSYNDKILTSQFLINNFKINNSPYIPTKTILIDLTRFEEEIFKSFSSNTRRAIRKAKKCNVEVINSTDIERFIKLKTRNMFPVSQLMAKDIKALWESFYPNNSTLLLASCFNDLNHFNKYIAGILLLFCESKVYYWLASSTKEGNILRAPSLLVWEALKLSKKKGYKVFDFEGVFDDRFPKSTNSWKGFSKFKQGFGGKEISYLGSFKS